MAYFIFKNSDNVTPFAVINEQTFDTTSASLTFIGRRRVDYGQVQNQNFLSLLENFAKSSAPTNPITGQLWYDTSQEYLKVFDGSTFVKVANTIVDTVAPSSPSAGQFWFDTAIQKLKMWNGSAWLIIGPSTDEAIAYSIVFGG